MTPDRIFARCAWRLLPLIIAAFIVNFLDRTNVGFAANFEAVFPQDDPISQRQPHERFTASGFDLQRCSSERDKTSRPSLTR